MKYGLIALLLTIFFPVFAQNDSTVSLSGSLNIHYGFIIPHAAGIEPVSHTNPAGFDISLVRFDRSKESRDVFNTFWFSGISVAYHNFRDPVVLGSAFTLTAFAEPVIFHGKRYFFSVRGGTGLSYNTKIYDEAGNPGNMFFATAINFPLYLGARLNIKSGGHSMLVIGGTYNHISNGGFKQPNYGMNFPVASVGLHYYPKEIPGLENTFSTDLAVPKRLSFLMQLNTAYKVVDKTDEYPEKGAFAFGLHIRSAKQLTRHYQLNAGAELMFDNSEKELIRRDNIDADYKRIALTAGQDFLFGKTTFTQYFGLYIYSPYDPPNLLYQKYELSYRFSKTYSGGVFLKAHGHVAELMGVQLSCFF